MTAKEPYIWLQEDEQIGRAGCGCVLVANYMGGDGAAIEFCRIHDAAPAMLAALRYAQGEACGGCGECQICTTIEQAEGETK